MVVAPERGAIYVSRNSSSRRNGRYGVPISAIGNILTLKTLSNLSWTDELSFSVLALALAPMWRGFTTPNLCWGNSYKNP